MTVRPTWPASTQASPAAIALRAFSCWSSGDMASSAVSLAIIFSQTRGTPKNSTGLTAPRVAPRLARSVQKCTWETLNRGR